MTGDVFEKDPLGAAFDDDAGDVWPEVARVVGPTAFASGTEGLARIPGQDGIEGTAEGAGIEATQVIPNRCRGEISCALGSDEDSSGPILPLDESPGVISGFGEHEAQIQASAACAEGQAVPGT